MEYVIPTLNSTSFHCPHCGVLSQQTWSNRGLQCYYTEIMASGQTHNSSFELTETAVALCKHCHMFSIWYYEKMVFPLTGGVETANPDLPNDVKIDYNEAKDIVNISPRGAAALLRLAI